LKGIAEHIVDVVAEVQVKTENAAFSLLREALDDNHEFEVEDTTEKWMDDTTVLVQPL
jgi:hypothetical protein